jgi:molecular chaperone DnaK
MKNYVGIDLGTTNSAISSFDGENLKLYKSPEQHDVTPSAIYVDKRGRKYLGRAAYDNAAKDSDNAAVLFKRVMGTSTPIKLLAAGRTMTPEECSAEILKVLFGYLPEEIRNSVDTGSVITVPAAFNQMQKDATMSAADMAGIGKVALMQEPVAAVMSVMRQRKGDGVFLVYDLGGGTLDIALAESISGRVNLLAHGGIAMCGGRDFDRTLLDNVVKPWLLENFDLPEDITVSPKFKSLGRMATWVAEKAKIALSSNENVPISDPAFDGMNFKDLSGKEIYLDIPLARQTFNELIAQKLAESIQAARETMEKAGLSPHDVERVVFVGGPTHYKPLRDKVAFELGIAPSTDVNPMTAVAEGAAVFAESIDWDSQSRGRKSTRGAISVGGRLDLAFNYIARTPDSRAKIVVKLGGTALAGAEFQIDSLDTGWSSGRIALKNDTTVEVILSKPNENTFKIFVFDAAGGPISFENNKIVITRTAAAIDAIPSSSSIGIEVLDKLGGRRAVLEYLVKEGEPLPKKGQKEFKSGETLQAGGNGAINFKLWEGDIDDPVTDNRFIGTFSINGHDFADGVISAGAKLVCDYEVLDSGKLVLEITVPSIAGAFRSNRNFYSRQAGQIDYTSASVQVHEDAESVRSRVEAVAGQVDDPKLDQAREKLDHAGSLDKGESDPETTKHAMDSVLEAKKLLAQVRKEHLKEIRQLDLDSCVAFFNDHIREFARPTETNSFDNLARTAQRSIDSNSTDFESHLGQLKGKNFEILWRQDWFVLDCFKRLASNTYLFPDKRQHAELVTMGAEAVKADDIDKLRRIVQELDSLKIGSGSEDDMFAIANIVRG